MISPELIKVLGPEQYWQFKYIAPFVLGSCLMVMYTFYTTVGLFYKKSGKVSCCVLIAAIVNIILNYFFIPKFGGVAAAYTSVVSYIILFSGESLFRDSIETCSLIKKFYGLFFKCGVRLSDI